MRCDAKRLYLEAAKEEAAKEEEEEQKKPKKKKCSWMPLSLSFSPFLLLFFFYLLFSPFPSSHLDTISTALRERYSSNIFPTETELPDQTNIIILININIVVMHRIA